ncbi:MAG: archaeosortase/exosortase family protein [Candidatus Nealsonbacteria bacterium]|nr:archaeosortase/exosortase family protein [Candidatus Nealsonbacteria bacterium]
MSTFSLTETKNAIGRAWPPSSVFCGWIVLIAALLIAYGQDTATIVNVWWNDPDSNHCFFVPLFAAALLWLRRDVIGAKLSTDKMIQWWPVGATIGAVVGLGLFLKWGTNEIDWQSDWWQPVVAVLYGGTLGAMVVQIIPLWASRQPTDPLDSLADRRPLALFVLLLLGFAGIWLGLWWGSAFFSYQKTVPLSVVPFLAGITLLLGGWRMMLWAWPAIAYMTFMVPLPEALSGWMRGPLMRLGTVTSVFIVQTMGIPAVRSGNQIVLEGVEPLLVAEACSGLRMLMLFFAICLGAAFWLRERPLWERIIVVASAPVIAVLANVIRIVVTAVLHHFDFGEAADEFFHEWAGLLMMPLGLLLLWAEWTLLQKLFLEPAPERPLSLGGSLVGPPGATQANPPGGTRRKSPGATRLNVPGVPRAKPNVPGVPRAKPNVPGVPRPKPPEQQDEDH